MCRNTVKSNGFGSYIGSNLFYNINNKKKTVDFIF